MTLPNFLIIGAAKAGTTSLHFYLDQHPEIQMSAVKETNFFAGPPEGVPYPVGRVDSRDAYEALFDPAFAVRGESSPSYSSAPVRKGVPGRIKDAIPDAKLVYLVRDPIARTVSQYQMLVAAGKESRPFPEAIAQLDSADPASFYLTCQSLYSRQLELYLGCFPDDRLLIIDQADLLADRERLLASVFAFLEVDVGFMSSRFDAQLFQGGERRRYPASVSRLKPLLRKPLGLVPERFRGAMRESVERRFLPTVPKPEVGGAERQRLVELFAPDAERLRALTGLACASWSV